MNRWCLTWTLTCILHAGWAANPFMGEFCIVIYLTGGLAAFMAGSHYGGTNE